MMMDEQEIRRSYEQAKSKEKQIGILAQLNDCSTKDIRMILGLEPKEEKEPRKKKAHTPKEEPQPEQKPEPVEEQPPMEKSELQTVIDSLYEEMEQLDKEIKEKEIRYKRIVTTLYTLNEYMQNHPADTDSGTEAQ